MKATKLIKDAVERRLNVTIEKCTIILQGRIFGDRKGTCFDAAIVNINETGKIYAIRVWHDKVAMTKEIESDIINEFTKLMMCD